jgi:DNA (cytosine-5)-methyltransferase 1
LENFTTSEHFVVIFSRHEIKAGTTRMMYDPRFAVFSNLVTPPLANDNIIPKHCHICDFETEEEERKAANVVREGGKEVGMKYNGTTLHPYDFVLYMNPEKGPGCIGQIQEIQSSSREIRLVVRRLGRVSQLAEGVLPEEECKDEVCKTHHLKYDSQTYLFNQRHLFLTKSTDIVDYTSIIRKIYVCSAINVGEAAREDWLSFAPEHFFLRYAFPSMNITDWNTRRRVSPEKLNICRRCMEERVEYFQSMKGFVSQKSQQPLRALDIFGGAAAMGAGMEMGSRCIKVTHAIELSPSTARTYR